jgi:hypothetical protein
MDNFKYAPGQSGYGTTGVDGSSGLSGLAVYFTTYDGDGTDTTTIKNKIDNNLILSPAVQKIPGYPTRVYQNGDIFIDINGKAYEIDLSNPNRFAYTGYNLSGTSLFIPSAIPGSTTDRYSNAYPNKIIDTVNAAVLSSDFYTDYPSIIYGISSKKFARIEYSNTDPDSAGRNPFTLFIGADTTPGDNKALALVRDIASNTFRLGNLDDLGALRQTNLIFDVQYLTQNKHNNDFSRTESDGTIITNHEVDTNLLLSPVFIYNPPSFISSSSTGFMLNLSWNKQDFFPTVPAGSLPTANLYFTQKQASYTGQEFLFNYLDPSTRPMVFPDIDLVGSIDVSGLVHNMLYEAYISFFDRGWQRNSIKLGLSTGINLIIHNPAPVCYPATIDLTNPAITAGSTPGLVYTYWNDAGDTSPVANPAAVPNGTYYIRGTSGGATNQGPVTATVVALPITALNALDPTTFCLGTLVHFSVTGGGAGATYQFRVNGNPVQTSASALFQTSSLTNGQIVTCLVTNSAGCSALATGSYTVSVNAIPTVSMTGPATACVNSTGNVYSTQGGQSNYVWNVTGGTITSGGSTSDNTVTVTWGSIGAKTVSVNYTNGSGCSAVSPTSYPVSVVALPVPTISGPAAPCVGVAGQVYTTEAGQSGYTWAVSAGGTINSGSGTNSISVTWTTTGAKNVTVNYTSPGGCTAATPSIYNLTVNALPVVALTGTTSVCAGSTGNVYTTDAGMSNYTWAISGGVITAGGISGSNTATVTWNAAGAGSISVNYTNGNGCTASSATSLGVTINAIPVPVVSGDTTAIINTAGHVYLTAPGQYSYAWSIVGGTIDSGQGTNSVSVTWTSLGAQSLSVSATSASGCTGNSASYGVSVSGVPATLDVQSFIVFTLGGAIHNPPTTSNVVNITNVTPPGNFWTATPNANWMVLLPFSNCTSGTGGTVVSTTGGPGSFQVSVGATGSPRSSSITVTSLAPTKTCQVNQTS